MEHHIIVHNVPSICSVHVSYAKRHVNTSVPIAFSASHSIYIATECQKTYNTALCLILIRIKFVCRQRARLSAAADNATMNGQPDRC